MKIDIETINELAQNIDKYNLNEIVIESEGKKIVLKKENLKAVNSFTAPVQEQVMEEIPKEETEVKENEDTLEYILSPMVGTFYTSSAPGNPAFVRIGTEVGMGETVCIIEAMKLMNEVKAEKNCKIIKILVEDGQVVKKGDKLFAIQ